jgi:hypothetical protein
MDLTDRVCVEVHAPGKLLSQVCYFTLLFIKLGLCMVYKSSLLKYVLIIKRILLTLTVLLFLF